MSPISACAGVIALLWPDITPMVLSAVIGAWALVTGAIGVALAFFRAQGIGDRAM